MPAPVGIVPSTNASPPRDSKGWDGKLRVDKKATITNPEALSDPDYSDEDAPPRAQIEADEDLLEEYESNTSDIDLVHCRISSIPALQLERFTNLEKLCLRQNQISHIDLPSTLAPKLQDLDLYDNIISHLNGLEHFTSLTSLDLSFNKIKHIKHLKGLTGLKDLYFVQNKIQKIEGLEGLARLRNLELAANRIREIENLDTLTGLEELWLGKNKITELKVRMETLIRHALPLTFAQNLSPLTNLKILSIQSNRLTQIQGLENLSNLEELYISHNALTTISGLDQTPNLRVLDISNNQITHLTDLEPLRLLEEVWASSNQLSSFEEVERQLADKKHLNTVYFEGNPLQTNNAVMYRNKVRLALPHVQQIDASK
ncbi:MAG: hypothetical protein LQ347_000259 [Umbilicaria vellea]|nr:MAG: hypothetical protein LQ347_000259 [Umbilicaria vellea]